MGNMKNLEIILARLLWPWPTREVLQGTVVTTSYKLDHSAFFPFLKLGQTSSYQERKNCAGIKVALPRALRNGYDPRTRSRKSRSKFLEEMEIESLRKGNKIASKQNCKWGL